MNIKALCEVVLVGDNYLVVKDGGSNRKIQYSDTSSVAIGQMVEVVVETRTDESVQTYSYENTSSLEEDGL